jgi:hypothetical protein
MEKCTITKVVIKEMKVKKCTQCNNNTYQKDGICVSCRIGISKMYDELKELMDDNKKWDLGLKPHK